MSARRRGAIAAALAGAAVAISPMSTDPAAAAPHPHGAVAGTVGGDLLGRHGVIVQPLSGAPALPGRKQLPAASWLVADLTTGQVLAAKSPHARYLPASTLKTLTAVTLLPRLRSHRLIRATNLDASVDGSRVGLVPRHSYTVDKLFTAMLMVSANDAADALAGAAGGIPATLDAMNATARHLQAFDTVAATPSGLDGPGESSSAYDLALIARAGFAMPKFRHYLAMVKSTMPEAHHKHFQIYTHNRLLTTYRGDLGGKNGYTVAAEGTYVGAARRHGHTIVVTLMHAYPNFWPMAKALFNWGFQAEGRVTPIGMLVGPEQPRPVALNAAAPLTPTRQQAVSRRGGRIQSISPVELTALGVSAIVMTLTLASRGARRRRRRLRRLRY